MPPRQARSNPPSDPSMSSEDVPSSVSLLANSAAAPPFANSAPPLANSSADSASPLADSADSRQLSALMAQIELLTTTVAQLSAAPAPSPAAAQTRLPLRPFVPLRATTFSGVENPETFINDLDRHYRLDSVFYDIDDDPCQINNAHTAMLGAAAVWFDNLAKSRPELLVAYSIFLAEFRRVYLSAQRLDNPFDHLRSLRMTGPMQEFVADFNARLARCPTIVHPLSSISDFRRALPAALSAELERSRVTRFGGKTEWPDLVEIQSAAAALAAARPRPATAAAAVTSSPTFAHTPSVSPSQALSSTYSSTFPSLSSSLPITPSSVSSPMPLSAAATTARSPEEIARRKAIAEDREQRGLCRYCGSDKHLLAQCQTLALKEGRGKA